MLSLRVLSSQTTEMVLKKSACLSVAFPWRVKSLSCLRLTLSTAVHSRSTAFDDCLADNPLPAQALSPADRAAERMAEELHEANSLQGLNITPDKRENVRTDNSAGDCVFPGDNFTDDFERVESGAESYGSNTIDEIRGESISYSDMHSIFRSLSLERDLVWNAKRSTFITVSHRSVGNLTPYNAISPSSIESCIRPMDTLQSLRRFLSVNVAHIFDKLI